MKFSNSIQTLACATAMSLVLAACEGNDGAAGPQGAAGDPGATGAAGQNSLISRTFVAAGNAQCFQGGTRIDTGLDTDADGTLAASEITSTSYECAATRLNDAENFVRIATFPVCTQIDATCNDDTETAPEILDVSADGMTLIYSDSPTEQIGFINLADPANPVAAGTLAVGGEPTSVAVNGTFALVGVNTSTDFVNTSGSLAVVNIATQTIVTTIDLGGQPDSVAVSPDGTFAAIAIENERDEDLNDGDIAAFPQEPAGFLAVVNMSDADPANWTVSNVDMTGLADIAPTDPEPEYVDINNNNVAVVTLQENNHIAIVDLATGEVTNHFSAGTLDLTGIDTVEEDIIDQSSSLSAVVREPDGVTWINDAYFATADEGDMDGGSRSFTIFDTEGNLFFTSGETLDQWAARIGHYPEGRSENKGVEPENAEVGTFGADRYLFVNSERASIIFVYDVADPTRPVLKQILPTNIGPEGAKAIPSRNLLVVASEEDNRGDKFRGSINVYQYQFTDAAYPHLTSANRENGSPIPWAAQSGLAADPNNSDVLYSIEDSAYDASRMFRIDASDYPAIITNEYRISDANDVFSNAFVLPAAELADAFDQSDLAALINDDKTVNIDPEGITVASDGGFWIASEGRGTVTDTANRPIESLNFLFKTDSEGVIEDVVTLPDAVNGIQVRFGFEGVALFDGKLHVAIQRAWGGEANPRIGIYDIASETWEFVFYPLNIPESQNGGWVGLSDISSIGDGRFLVIERDNQGGPDAAIKRLYTVDLSNVTAGQTVTKTLVRDLIASGDMTATGGAIIEKVEGAAVASDGDVWISTDNDGVDDSSGETLLLNLGPIVQ